MGACSSNQAPDQAQEQSMQIDKDLLPERRAEKENIKVLVLGTVEAGKSTVCKQLVSVHSSRPPIDNKEYINLICRLAFKSLEILVEQAHKAGLTPTASMPTDEQMTVNQSNAQQLKCVWEDAVIQQVYENRAQFYLSSSAAHFLNKIEEIACLDYTPSQADVLRCRVPSMGIDEFSFVRNGVPHTLFDVSGQRANECKKWMHCFENVTVVFFVLALSDYNRAPPGEPNALAKAVDVFEEHVNSRWFHDVDMIVVLNKSDEFEEQLKKTPLNVCPIFASHEGANTKEAGCELLKTAMLARMQHTKHEVLFHTACALNVNEISPKMLDLVKTIALGRSLRSELKKQKRSSKAV